MNLKTLNEFFGYGLFCVGALKIIFTILIFMQMITNVNIAFNGGDGTDYGVYPIISVLLGGFQILLAIGSIVMIIVNSTNQPSVIPGYLLGLGAILIEIITPSILYIFVQFFECGLYMKGGSKIRENNISYQREYRPKTSKQTIGNMGNYYNSSVVQNEKEKAKIQKRKEKLEKELEEWKQLLDSGEIDEETYTQETNRLIEKQRKRESRYK